MNDAQPFPLRLGTGNATVTIYQVQSKPLTRFTVAYRVRGRRRLKQFAELDKAKAWAEKRM